MASRLASALHGPCTAGRIEFGYSGRMRLVMSWGVAICLGLSSAACSGDDGPAPRAPGAPTSPSGRSPRGGLPPGDAGRPVDAGDSDSGTGSPDPDPTAPVRRECAETAPARFTGEDPAVEPLATSTAPDDFAITRVLAAWDAGEDCSDPAFRIELSGGRCPDGDGHGLVFWFDADAIEDGEVGLGLNDIRPEPGNGIQVRYYRHARLRPSGEWGTCTQASGTLTLRGDPPAVNRVATWRGTFMLELTACASDTTGVQQVIGSFNTTMRRRLDEVCPGR
jgi:hypothetical protein